jgi:predicted DNA-binding protein (MmcQ/YjbR family)
VKTVFFLVASFVSWNCSGQSNLSTTQIDSIVSTITKDSGHIDRFRWVRGYIEYSSKDNALTMITDSYKAGPRLVILTYYMMDTSLIFASRHATSYYFYGDDTVFLGMYYFEKKKLKYYWLYRDEEDLGENQIQEAILASYDRVKAVILARQQDGDGD